MREPLRTCGEFSEEHIRGAIGIQPISGVKEIAFVLDRHIKSCEKCGVLCQALRAGVNSMILAMLSDGTARK